MGIFAEFLIVTNMEQSLWELSRAINRSVLKLFALLFSYISFMHCWGNVQFYEFIYNL